MKVQAKSKYLHMSPRKVRLVANFVRGKKVSVAVQELRFLKKSAAEPVRKVLESAIANAVNNFEMKESELVVSEITINDGPTIKRFRPRARGNAAPIRKRTSHLTVSVDLASPVATKNVETVKEKKPEAKKVEDLIATDKDSSTKKDDASKKPESTDAPKASSDVSEK
jgi:large subunit ribosomal protein L22